MGVISALLASNASINTADKNGETPLHIVVSQGRADIVQTLLTGGGKHRRDELQ